MSDPLRLDISGVARVLESLDPADFGNVVWRQAEHPDYAAAFASRATDGGRAFHEYLRAGKPVYEPLWSPYRVVARTPGQIHVAPDEPERLAEVVKVDRVLFDAQGAVTCRGEHEGRWVSTARVLWENRGIPTTPITLATWDNRGEFNATSFAVPLVDHSNTHHDPSATVTISEKAPETPDAPVQAEPQSVATEAAPAAEPVPDPAPPVEAAPVVEAEPAAPRKKTRY